MLFEFGEHARVCSPNSKGMLIYHTIQYLRIGGTRKSNDICTYLYPESFMIGDECEEDTNEYETQAKLILNNWIFTYPY